MAGIEIHKVPVVKVQKTVILNELPAGFKRTETLHLSIPVVVEIQLESNQKDGFQERREFLKRPRDEDDGARAGAAQDEVAVAAAADAGEVVAARADAAASEAADVVIELSVASREPLAPPVLDEPPESDESPEEEEPATQPAFEGELESLGMSMRVSGSIQVQDSQTP